jgi:hypothetical protein
MGPDKVEDTTEGIARSVQIVSPLPDQIHIQPDDFGGRLSPAEHAAEIQDPCVHFVCRHELEGPNEEAIGS